MPFNDLNGGQSRDEPWKSIDRINQVPAFQPGDRILLKAGSSWTGQLRPRGSGTRESPIVIDMYGMGNKPRIDGGVEDTNALQLYNQSFWRISNLELTNQNKNKPNDRTRRGIYVEAQATFVQSIHLTNLLIHDVRGLLAIATDYNKGKDSAGIGFEVTDTANGARFDDLLVDGCIIRTIDSTGVFTKGTGSVYPRSDGWNAIKFTNVVIQNNKISDIGKNAIIVRHLDGGYVQRNTVWDTAFRCRSGNQIFSRTCYGTVFQYNEGYLNRAIDDMDGSAFDADLESPATVWQYNYSHDNAFGLMTFCTNPADKDIVVRYNVSQNDRGRILNINYGFTSAAIYNNVFFISTHLSPHIIWETSGRTGANFIEPQNYSFDNNIVYNLSPTATYNLNSNTGTRRQTTRTVRNNCFYGEHPPGEPYSLPASSYHVSRDNFSRDPAFVNPGRGASGSPSSIGHGRADHPSMALSPDSFSGLDDGPRFEKCLDPIPAVFAADAVVFESAPGSLRSVPDVVDYDATSHFFVLS